MARLKVFTWSDGFHAFSVATTSRPKALEAWGIGSDIFKTGLASETASGPDHDAALASPGEVIERGLSIDVGRVSKAAKPKPASVRDRAALRRLEADLDALDAAQAQEAAALDARRAAIDAEADALTTRQARSRKALLARLKAARSKL